MKRIHDIRTLTGPWLDYLVAEAEQRQGYAVSKPLFILAEGADTSRDWYSPSMKPEHGWPIIERLHPQLRYDAMERFQCCLAFVNLDEGRHSYATGPTYLIAFCRAYAIAVLGSTFETNFPEDTDEAQSEDQAVGPASGT